MRGSMRERVNLNFLSFWTQAHGRMKLAFTEMWKSMKNMILAGGVRTEKEVNSMMNIMTTEIDKAT